MQTKDGLGSAENVNIGGERLEQKAENKVRPTYTLAKNHLINYRMYKTTIERRLVRLNEIKNLMGGMKAIDYSKDRVQSSPVEDIMDNIITEKLQVENDLRRAIAIVADIEKGLEQLDKEQREVIELKYMGIDSYSTTWWMVAKKIGYSVETCKRRGKSAILKMAEVIFEG